MAASAPPTILSLKQTFVETQTRLLSQPLPQPSPAWHDHNASSDHPLALSAVEDALFRLNQTLQQHARRVYPPQSTRIVAEQIDKLYQGPWGDGSGGAGTREAGEGGDEQEEEAMPALGADLTSSATIAALPATWPSPRDATAYPMETARYAHLAAHMAELAEKRAEARDRVHRLRAIKDALGPFSRAEEAEDGEKDYDGEKNKNKNNYDGEDRVRNDVQPNLVTRGGEVEKELERMRMLLARVGGRVAALPGGSSAAGAGGGGRDGGDDDVMVIHSPAVVERRKVDGLLELF